MLKSIFIGLALSVALGGAALAQQCPSSPYTLTNGATADAGQVMADFNNILTCVNGRFSSTTNSASALDVRSSSSAGVPVALFGYGQAGVALEQNWPGFYFNNYYINGANYYMGSGYAGILNLDSQNGDFYIGTTSASGSTGQVVSSWNTPSLYIKNNGNVGIGNTSPGNSLDVQGATATTGSGNLCVHNSASNTGICLESYNSNISASGVGIIQSINNAGTSPQPLLLNPFSGNVGIGTVTPSYTLTVNGTTYATGAAGALSDARHKDNIKPLAKGALAEVEKLRPVTFTWKEPKDDGMKGEQIGLIAQDVQKVLPDIVLIQKNDEKTLSLKYDELIPVLVKAMQEQQAQIQAQQAEIAQLKAAAGIK